MWLRWLAIAALAFFAACTSRGCDSAQSVTVRYRGNEVLQETAQVSLGSEQIGFIAEVIHESGVQRAKLRVTDASKLTDKDTFLAMKDAAGKTGLMVRSGAGKPLLDGAQVDSIPNWAHRERLAALAKEAPGGITLPSGYYVPYPQAFTRERLSPGERFERSVAERLPRALRLPKGRDLNVDPGTRNRYEQFSASIAGQPLEVVQRQFVTEGGLLMNELTMQLEAARAAKDPARMRDVRMLLRNLERAKDQLDRAAKAREVRGRAPERQPRLPPELR